MTAKEKRKQQADLIAPWRSFEGGQGASGVGGSRGEGYRGLGFRVKWF